MPSAREIRRRIRSVRNTSQITKALEMVAAARLRHAQAAVLASRPYAEQLAALVGTLATSGGGDDEQVHPLLLRRPVEDRMLVFITPDRGLAGAMVGNVLRAGVGVAAEHNPPHVAVGRRGRDWLHRRNRNVVADFTPVPNRPTMDDVREAARIAIDEFSAGTVDEVTLIYTKFISNSQQRPQQVQLLPIEPPTGVDTARYANFLFEPSPGEVLAAILPRYVEVQIFQALLESRASEESARMIAMHNATENAKDIVKSLTLSYNKARQAGITKEILEISSGAEALRAASA
jgi:F-type H+-transporting ATPase subunit gamma